MRGDKKINETKIKSQNKFYLALITVSLGVLTIFVINNLIARIDTHNWRLDNLDIIPVMEPIGNDFRVGLYWPAENLLKSGFKAISPDGTYPSIYPPLVNVFSLPYLLLDAQTAYLVHVAILFICNLASLLIATLMIKKLFLDRVVKDQLASSILSILLFIIISFYNFSSYPFLFSMERGNVDAIAMVFLMLAMWTLIRQPKNIWLQVILLSIATHFKIYPAALFIVLFYYHGKKLIFPFLITNLAFLLVLGPKNALSFIQSLTSGGGGAGIGNNSTWVGNHAAYSFAESLTLIYPRFTKFFYDIWIVCMLIPFSIWIQGTTRIIRNKYTPMNAVLLLMISIPIMDILPTISMDYRLIILSTSFLLFIGVNFSQILCNPSRGRIIELLLVIIIMFFIARPYDMDLHNPYGLAASSSYFINNKYLWSLALEGIMVWNIIRHQKDLVEPDLSVLSSN
jgi:hypothetical protein